jgi:histidine triad (HIT) family protein
MERYCVFCEIIARREPATVLYESDDVIAIHNVLRWVPVMLLVMPKRHLTQSELWEDMGEVGRVAAALGREHCPRGFRLLSNFGRDGMQSQEHAHVHVLGGTFLGEYVS